MRDVKRINKMVQTIQRIWYQAPDMRLTQMLSNAAHGYCGWELNDLYHLEDERLLRGLVKLAEKIEEG